MRVAILLCLCSVILCEGRSSRSDTDEQLVKILDLLQHSFNQPPNTENPKHRSGNFQRQHDFTMGPPKEDPWTYDMDRLYEFPGSNFLLKMIEMNFTATSGPFSVDWMQDIPIGGPPYMKWFLRSMEPQMFSTMTSFYGDYTGLPELFARKVTEWIASVRFACPSAFFDKFFARWSMKEMEELFGEEDDDMVNFFQGIFMNFFTNMTEEEVRKIAEEATLNIHWWLVDEMMQHIYGSGFRDVAVFSHKLYWRLWNHYNVNMTAYPLTPSGMASLSDMVWPTYYESAVRCETGMDVLTRHSTSIYMFKASYELITETVIMGHVYSFLAMNALQTGYNMNDFPETDMSAIAEKIDEYIGDMVVFLEDHEVRLMDIDNRELLTFFEELEEKGEEGFAYEMFYRLGLENIIRASNRLDPDEAELLGASPGSKLFAKLQRIGQQSE